MVPDPDRALVIGVIAALTGAPAVAALVGAAVFDEPPDGAPSPCILVGASETTPTGGLPPAGAAEAVAMALTLTILSRFGGAEEARAITAAARGALHDAALALDGCRLVNLRLTSAEVRRVADGRLVTGTLRLRAVVEAL